MRLRNLKNKEQILENSPYVILDYHQYKGKWNTLFGNSNPIYLEIGMGMGKFLVENALKYPNINFIGVEKFDNVVARCVTHIPSDIPNLRIVRMNALEIDEVFDHEIHRLYLNFSDPWPKKRHFDRRLTSPIFLEKYDSIFFDSKRIDMKTDNSSLFTYSICSFSRHGYIIDDISLDYHRDFDQFITTEYEEKFASCGMPIYYVSVSSCLKK